MPETKRITIYYVHPNNKIQIPTIFHKIQIKYIIFLKNKWYHILSGSRQTLFYILKKN